MPAEDASHPRRAAGRRANSFHLINSDYRTSRYQVERLEVVDRQRSRHLRGPTYYSVPGLLDKQCAYARVLYRQARFKASYDRFLPETAASAPEIEPGK
jgi:hypothetical protein